MLMKSVRHLPGRGLIVFLANACKVQGHSPPASERAGGAAKELQQRFFTVILCVCSVRVCFIKLLWHPLYRRTLEISTEHQF
jgi:hypothetical protein